MIENKYILSGKVFIKVFYSKKKRGLEEEK